MIEVKQIFIEALLSFGDTLYQLAEDIDKAEVLRSLKSSSPSFSYSFTSSKNHELTVDKKLLRVLKNCYILTRPSGALENIVNAFDEKILSKDNGAHQDINVDDLDDIDFDDLDVENLAPQPTKPKEKLRDTELVKNTFETFEKLSNIILNKWLRRKTNNLSSILRKGILDPGFKWTNAHTPQTIRGYMIETLLAFTLVHHEACDMKAKYDFPSNVCKVLKRELLNSFNDTCFLLPDDISSSGSLQLDVEITFFDECLAYFDTEESATVFSKIRGKLIDYCEDLDFGNAKDKAASFQMKKIKDDIIRTYKEKTTLQLAGFKSEQPTRTTKAPERRKTFISRSGPPPFLLQMAKREEAEEKTTTVHKVIRKSAITKTDTSAKDETIVTKPKRVSIQEGSSATRKPKSENATGTEGAKPKISKISSDKDLEEAPKETTKRIIRKVASTSNTAEPTATVAPKRRIALNTQKEFLSQ